MPGTATVLVAEDDASIRLLLRALLSEAGLRVVEAADGEAVLAAAEEEPPDAILLDIGLPVLDGLTVLRRLKADPRLAPVPVIVVTAWGEPDYEDRARLAGAHDYVRKPFDTAELVERVRALTEP